jgi:23S rRNA pseudouridine1911/1915/1917 synthase
MPNLSIEILYDDTDVLVVNKPAGLVVHPDGHTVERTLCDWILENYPELKNVGEPLKMNNSIPRPGIVHRLDRETSGALVIAKNQNVFLFLKKQFQDRVIEKNYRTFVYGVMKNDNGVIDRPIARSKNDFRKWTAERGKRGEERQAVTEYQVLGRIPAAVSENGDESGFSFLDVFPKTGRTHQIRVHLKAVSHPIVCDKLYAPKKERALGFNRLALHAFSIKFALPSGKDMKIEAPYPEDFKKALTLFDLT